MRWRTGPVRKRHVPEPERLRQLAAKLKGEADRLSQKADALLAEAEALEAADQHPITLVDRFATRGITTRTDSRYDCEPLP